MYIIGISAYFHDSAATLLKDGKIIAAVEEERFSRVKHDNTFPDKSIQFLLTYSGVQANEIQAVVYFEKPFSKFDRLLENTFAFAPRGFSFFKDSFPSWIKEKLFLKQKIRKELKVFGLDKAAILFSDHHRSHAASAFFPSPFKDAAVLCIDGVGEWTTTSLWKGTDRQLECLFTQKYPHSLGLFYSAITGYSGFKVNSDEYKLMGLAPYGEPRYVDILEEYFIDIKEDGSFHLNMELFDFGRKQSMFDNNKVKKILGLAPRSQNQELTIEYADLAQSAQKVTEKIILRLAKTLQQLTNQKNLCLAGGVALNCVANGLLAQGNLFEKIWIQPAAGDSGGSLGAAMSYYHEGLKKPRLENQGDQQQGSLLGPSYNEAYIESLLKAKNRKYQKFQTTLECDQFVAQLLSKGLIGGFFQGRMEFGPRALGSRSIIADPRLEDGQSRINRLIKFRESFRPFAPAILLEHVEKYFEPIGESPYMLVVSKLKKMHRLNSEKMSTERGLGKIKIKTSELSSVVHVDYSARLQTISKDYHSRFHQLIDSFYELTGCPAVVNTSFNVNGEPIVCTPDEALNCFDQTGLHFVVLENFLLLKDKK
jgi:carbamoyltransferase